MNKDLVIYDKNTRDIYIVIKNTPLQKDSIIITNDVFGVAEVDNTNNYIFVDGISPVAKLRYKSNIIYLDDYRNKYHD